MKRHGSTLCGHWAVAILRHGPWRPGCFGQVQSHIPDLTSFSFTQPSSWWTGFLTPGKIGQAVTRHLDQSFATAVLVVVVVVVSVFECTWESFVVPGFYLRGKISVGKTIWFAIFHWWNMKTSLGLSDMGKNLFSLKKCYYCFPTMKCLYDQGFLFFFNNCSLSFADISYDGFEKNDPLLWSMQIKHFILNLVESTFSS